MKREKVIISASVEFLLDIPATDITEALNALNSILKIKAQEIIEANKKIETASVKELNVRMTY